MATKSGQRKRTVKIFYKENPFWGAIGAFLTFFLAGGGFTVSGNIPLGRLLTALAWPWAGMALWLSINGLVSAKRTRIACTVVAVVFLVAAGYRCDRMLYRQDYPRVAIIVTPPEMTFRSSGDAFTFTIQNITNHDVYNATVKVSYGVDPREFIYTSPDTTGKPIEAGTPERRMSDMQAQECRSVARGSYNTYILVLHMMTKEARDFTITYNGSTPVSIKMRSSFTYAEPKNKPLGKDAAPPGEWALYQTDNGYGALIDEDCQPVTGAFLLR